jgi:hypothetical protein
MLDRVSAAPLSGEQPGVLIEYAEDFVPCAVGNPKDGAVDTRLSVSSKRSLIRWRPKGTH